MKDVLSPLRYRTSDLTSRVLRRATLRIQRLGRAEAWNAVSAFQYIAKIFFVAWSGILATFSLFICKGAPNMRTATAALAAILSFSSAAAAQDNRETEFIVGLLESMNQLSIRFNREVCGFILQDDEGTYSSTKASWGGEASCASMPLEPGMRAVSSWHTHAAWGRGYDGEVPSVQDVEGDMRFGVNGWVGTPGGRLWFVNGTTGTVTQICGRGCLPEDPNFFPEEHGPVAGTYTLDTLYSRFGQAR